MNGPPAAHDGERGGLVIAALCVAFSAYVACFPNHLGDSDEPLILYEAKRLLHGAVFYRDIFEIITPGSQYFFAALFGVFGTTLSTARLAMAVVQGGIAALILTACRGFTVRWWLAIAAALAHLALGQPAWPYASPHWLSTLLLMLLFVATLRRPWTRGAAGAIGLGAIVGVTALVQQQKAAMLLPAVAAAVICDRLLDRRYAIPPPPRATLVRLLGGLLGGVLLLTVPLLGLLAWAAGPAAMFDALIRHPLTRYPALHAASAQWGLVSVFSVGLARYTLPSLLRWQPVVLIPAVLRLAALVSRRAGAAQARRLATLLVFALGSIASVSYFPDFIHLAFIAPVFYVAAAEVLEQGLRRVPRPAARPIGLALAGVLIAALAGQLVRNLQRAYADSPLRVQTRFGRLDLRDRGVLDLAEQVQRLLPPGAPRQIFCYPECLSLYLLSDTDNPTPYQKLLSGYNSPAAVEHALRVLDASRAPLAHGLFADNGDPVGRYVLEHYTPVAGSPFYLRNAEQP